MEQSHGSIILGPLNISMRSSSITATGTILTISTVNKLLLRVVTEHSRHLLEAGLNQGHVGKCNTGATLFLVLDWADIAKILGAVCSWGISSAVSEPVEVSLRFWINSLLWKWLQETLSKSSLSWDDGSCLLSIKLILWKVVKAVNLIIPGDFTIKELLINLFDHIL